MNSSLFDSAHIDLSGYEYNKFKIFIGLIPSKVYPFFHFSFKVKDNYDFELVRNVSNQKCFIPIYKTIGPYLEPVYAEEYEENMETGSKVKKILPYSFLNSFMLTKTDIPLCYGYFTSIDMINSAYQNRLKGYLLTAAEKNQIRDSALIEQISTFKLRQTK